MTRYLLPAALAVGMSVVIVASAFVVHLIEGAWGDEYAMATALLMLASWVAAAFWGAAR